MMNTELIARIIAESGLAVGGGIPTEALQKLRRHNRDYPVQDFEEFKRDLREAAQMAGFQFHSLDIPMADLTAHLDQQDELLIFRKSQESVTVWVVQPQGRKWRVAELTGSSGERILKRTELAAYLTALDASEVWSFLRVQPLVSDSTDDEKPSPAKRLFRLLQAERQDIIYILIYAVFIGLVSLVIPLGIQTTIELVSGGVFFSSVYIMIAGVIVAVLIAGGMQVFQLTLVEYLQRRIFAKASFEFAYRFPHLDAQSMEGTYAPGLVNRFLDVLTLQKGLPKFLIEFSAAGLQILFGLLLLSLYHPFFVVFGIGLIGFLSIIFYLTGGRALKTSIKESSYKYKLLHWLEDVARMHQTFKLTGTTTIPYTRTDYFVNNYLKNRKNHFRLLLLQFTYIVFFKAIIIGGLLIIGTMLVIGREITLGQFVASEVIIILILNSVEKLIMYMDVVYDLLTAVDKLGAVTDLAVERRGGADMTLNGNALGVTAHGLSYPGSLQGLDLNVSAGEKICVSGTDHAARKRLGEILEGLYSQYGGALLINGYSMRDLDLTHYRDHISANGTNEELFEGSVQDNIVMGNPKINTDHLVSVLEKTGLTQTLASWPEGLETEISSTGTALSPLVVQQILMARCLARKPGLVLISDHFFDLSPVEKIRLLDPFLQDPACTVICFSNDPVIMGACGKVVVVEDGKMATQGDYPELLRSGQLKSLTN